MLKAAKVYAPQKGYKFSAYLGYQIKNAFNELTGLRTNAQRKRPLNCAASLDEIIPGTEDVAKAESIPSKTALQAFKAMEARILNEQLHNALEECLNELEPKQASVIRQRYYNGKTHRELAEMYNVALSRVHQIEREGFRKIRAKGRKLRAFADELIATNAYHYVGFNSWSNGGSSQERITELLKRVREERKTFFKQI